MNKQRLFYTLSICALALGGTDMSRAEEVSAATTPCGYIMKDVPAKSTSYIGLGVHGAAVMKHTLEAANVTKSGSKVTVTDPDVNFQTLLNGDESYELELVFGTDAVTVPLNRDAWKGGTNSNWTASAPNSIVFTDKAIAARVAKSTPDSYIIRKAQTVKDVFGETNSIGLKAGSTLSADTIIIPVSESATISVYYSSKQQWMRKGSTADAGNVPVFSGEPMTITRKAGTTVQNVILGEVSQKNRSMTLTSQKGAVNSGLAIPQSLASTGLQNELDSSDTVTVSINNALVECTYNGSNWVRRDTGALVSDQMVDGVFVIKTGLSTPTTVTVQSTTSES